ncbi:MAG TPA: inosine/xanthosine triphosphatase [Blastocatellia bacterium]|nr:inosine/xanthosine triphosphatase [Blastocatellia bacterium]
MTEKIRVALASTRLAKREAVEQALERMIRAGIVPWRSFEIIPRAVMTAAPAMPLTDDDLLHGARQRVERLIELFTAQGSSADFYVGLEGGFHRQAVQGQPLTFLRSWAYVSDGERGFFGCGPSILVPEALAETVISTGEELGDIIDHIARQSDVRSQQGTWGVLSRNLVTRSETFALALIAAFAPFYNPHLYERERHRA